MDIHLKRISAIGLDDDIAYFEAMIEFEFT